MPVPMANSRYGSRNIEMVISEEANDVRPIVFLDIDGVLNSRSFFERRRSGDVHLDTSAIEILNRLSDDVDFVVSSTWRADGVESVQKRLDEAGFTGKLVDRTPYCKCRVRGVEVKQWLSDNRTYGFDRYAIIDDDSDFLIGQQPHFFHVDNYHGLTPNTIHKIRKFLKLGS